MKMKHTKGEWILHQDRTRSFMVMNQESEIIAEIGEGWLTKEEVEANAKLIATAPDLLQALQSLRGIEAWISDPEMKKLFIDTVYPAINKATA